MIRHVQIGVLAAAVILLSLADVQAVTVYLTTRDTGDVTLGTVTFERGDIVAYDTDTATASLFFDGRSYFRNSSWVTGVAENIDALYVYRDGRILLSTDSAARLGQNHLAFDSGDVVLFDMATDTASVLFSGYGSDSLFRGSGWNLGASENVDAFDLMDNGHYLLSTTGDARLGVNHLAFKPGDIVEYDPVNDQASVYFGSTLFRTSGGAPVGPATINVDGVALFDGDLLLSVAEATARLGALPHMLTFTDGDIVRYDRATDQASIFFSQDLLHCDARDIDGLSVLSTVPGPPPIPEPITMCGLCMGVLGLAGYVRRRAAAA